MPPTGHQEPLTGGPPAPWQCCPVTLSATAGLRGQEGEVSAEEEGFENLSTMASTFIVLFLLSLFYSTTVTLFKVK
ncbi:Ectonucleoside triphosphate diphosphohydrolase 5 [Manis javanica]|nr:Ectonucleoside triphosphate diphosphohydrolase 5 [Manis javanica]